MFAAPWSYPEDIVSMTIEDGDNPGEDSETERIVDFSRGPPAYEGNEDFISKLKQDLGIKVSFYCVILQFKNAYKFLYSSNKRKICKCN